MQLPLDNSNFFHKQKKFWESSEIRNRRTPDHPVIRAFAEPKINFVLGELYKFNENVKNLEMLDVGSGNGFLSYYFEKEFKSITCTDFSQAILDINPCKNKILAKAEHLPFPDKSFDVVFSSNILHHLSDPIVALKEMRRVARKFMIISDVNRKNFVMNAIGLIKNEERGIAKLPIDYIDEYFNDLGLAIVARKDFGLILPNITNKHILPLLAFLERRNFFTPLYSMAIAKISDENEKK
ncbi:MAG: class I SAM-dependent methyltransferase [Candidatus Buchananbacteria bacterium]|jgi:ubiquinone/menaquinone biosynthesis C-methylase UbiE